MTSNRHAFPYRWVLPGAQLLLCFIALLPGIGFLSLQMHRSAHAYWPQKVEDPIAHLGPRVLILEPDSSPPTIDFTRFRLALPAVINLPSWFVGLGVWAPKDMLREYWRAITFPLAGVVFWYFAGRGIEALLATRSRCLSPAITWTEFCIALLIVIFCAMLCAGMVMDPSIREELVFPWLPAFVASVMWILLGSATVAARILQWRIRRRLRLIRSAENLPA